MPRRPTRALAAALALAGLPAVAAAQAPTPAPRLALSVAGGPASGAPLGVSRQVTGHGLVALAYAPRRWPAEVRADVMVVAQGADVSLGLSGVLPIARVAVAGGAVRPYLLAGVGVAGVGPSSLDERRFGAQAGAGVRLERAGYGAFGEVRRHTAYGQSFLSFGATLRR